MDRREFLKLSALTAGACVMGGSLAEAAEKMTSQPKKTPNLLFIYPDQYRLYSMGFWRKPEYRNALPTAADPVVTPVIDKLADESVVFTQAYSCFPVCGVNIKTKKTRYSYETISDDAGALHRRILPPCR